MIIGQDLDSVSAYVWQASASPIDDIIDGYQEDIRAVAYINADWDAQSMWSAPYHQGYWSDTRIHNNPAIRQKWLEEIGDNSIWLHGGPDLNGQLMYINIFIKG